MQIGWESAADPGFWLGKMLRILALFQASAPAGFLGPDVCLASGPPGQCLRNETRSSSKPVFISQSLYSPYSFVGGFNVSLILQRVDLFSKFEFVCISLDLSFFANFLADFFCT